jgi:hypothetical protein
MATASEPAGLWRAIRSLFAWREVRRDNHWSYAENIVTGARRIRRHNFTRGWPAALPDVLWAQGHPWGETYRRMGPPPRPNG